MLPLIAAQHLKARTVHRLQELTQPLFERLHFLTQVFIVEVHKGAAEPIPERLVRTFNAGSAVERHKLVLQGLERFKLE